MAFLADELVHQPEQAPRLGWQFIEGTAQDFPGDAVGGDNVRQRHFNIHCAIRRVRGGLRLPLVLVQECQRVNQGQIFLVVAPGARAVVQEREALGKRIDDAQRSQEPLRVAVGGQDGRFVELVPQPVQRAGLALQLVDAARLLAALVHRQHNATV